MPSPYGCPVRTIRTAAERERFARACGVNPVDAYIRAGSFAFKPNLPYTPGADGAGVIEAVGEGVDQARVGEQVVIYPVLSCGHCAACLPFLQPARCASM